MSLFKKLTKLERVNKNIDAKQKSVDQLGATENPRKIKVLDTDKAPAHPFDGKLVGEESEKKSLRDPKDNPCWKGYKPVGTKQKDGRTVPNCVPKEGVAEGSVNDYFKRRKDEEDRIAGIKAPAKRSPRQTDYAKRRAQEKKVDQGVAEGSGKNKAYTQGEEAGKKSHRAENNPYKLGSPEHREWESGRKGTVPDRSRFLPSKKSVSEGDKHSMLGKIQRGHELKKKVDSSFKDWGDAQKTGDKQKASKAFRVDM